MLHLNFLNVFEWFLIDRKGLVANGVGCPKGRESFLLG